MADLIIPDFCGNIVSKWSHTGKANPITSTCGVHDITDGGTDPEAILSEFYNGWVTSGGYCVAANMTTGWSFLGCSMIWNTGAGMVGYETADAPVAGTATDTGTIVLSGAVILRKKTGFVGKHFRGRMYLPPLAVTETGVDPMGNIEPTVVLPGLVGRIKATTDFWDASVPTWEPVLLHQDSVITPGFNPITSWITQSKIGTQRRRIRN